MVLDDETYSPQGHIDNMNFRQGHQRENIELGGHHAGKIERSLDELYADPERADSLIFGRAPA